MTMLPLSPGEVAEMRGVMNVSLPGTAIIYTSTDAPDGQGGVTQTFAASGTAAGRLSPIPTRVGVGGEAEQIARIAVIADYILTLPAATTIGEKDRVDFAGTTYEVTLVADRPTWELGRRVYVTQIA